MDIGLPLVDEPLQIPENPVFPETEPAADPSPPGPESVPATR